MTAILLELKHHSASKKMEYSEKKMFYEPYRAFLELTTQLDGISYKTGSYALLDWMGISRGLYPSHRVGRGGHPSSDQQSDHFKTYRVLQELKT